MKTLIIIDMQNDFITGPLGTPEAQKVEKSIAKWLHSSKWLHPFSNDQIYVTRDTHDGDYLATPEGIKLPIPHCICGSKGWQVSSVIMKQLEKSDVFYTFINKRTFGYPDWNLKNLHGAEDDEIVLIGVCTDICIISNALILKSMFPYAQIRIISSLCAGTTPENHQKALDVMKSCQIEVI